MKKITLILVLVAAIGFGYYYFSKSKYSNIIPLPDKWSNTSRSPLPASITPGMNPSIESNVKPFDLNKMLARGFKTQQGILQSHKTNHNDLERYRISLNGKTLPINAVSEIELIDAFLIGKQQVLLFGFNQGGNQCSIQYQTLTITTSGYQLSKVFGSCLPLISSQSQESQIIFAIPQNNPYLGNDVTIHYIYRNGQVIRSKSSTSLKNKFAKLSPHQILLLASRDGCYIDGVMLDDNACANGRKYCVMFKNLSNPPHDQDYKFLKDFCH